MKHLRKAIEGTPVVRLKEGVVYTLTDDRGNDMKVRVVGIEGDEVVVSAKFALKKSSLVSDSKKLKLIQKILLATGFFGAFS